MKNKAVFETNFPDVKLKHRGKVRDVYELGDHYLIVATDRLSAFDVVLPTPIPGKGKILTQMSLFWFDMFKDDVENHLVAWNVDDYPDVLKKYKDELEDRSMLVKKCNPMPVECIVRGYITGSAWKEYQKTGMVCGIKLPANMQESEPFPEPLFTPSTKAEAGQHDENISYEKMVEIVGEEKAAILKEKSLFIYSKAAEYAKERGVIIADTKFEFGELDGKIILIDEILTPDSSRFWPMEDYQVGRPQPSFDKQYVRDYLESIGWNKKPPAPELPPEIVEKTISRYQEALDRLVSSKT